MIGQFNDLEDKYYCKNPYNILSKKDHKNTKTGLKLERQRIYFNEKLFQILLLLKLHFH